MRRIASCVGGLRARLQRRGRTKQLGEIRASGLAARRGRALVEVYNWCQVVFTFEKPPDLDERLARIAGRVREFKPLRRRAGDNEDEQRLASVLTTRVPYTKRIRVPARLTDGSRAYTVSVAVFRKHLPERRLTLPHFLGKALPDEERGDKSKVVMVPYPDA